MKRSQWSCLDYAFLIGNLQFVTTNCQTQQCNITRTYAHIVLRKINVPAIFDSCKQDKMTLLFIRILPDFFVPAFCIRCLEFPGLANDQYAKRISFLEAGRKVFDESRPGGRIVRERGKN